MRPLEGSERRILMLWSVALCVGSLLLAPLAARSSIDVSAQQELAMRTMQLPDITQPAKPASLSVSRDPFTADVPPAADLLVPLGTGASAAADSVVGKTVQAGAPLGIVLPPNSGAAGMSVPMAASASTVAAIITGDRPQALVYESGHSRIISVGERLEGHKVTAIDSTGVQLDDGSTRRLAEDHL